MGALLPLTQHTYSTTTVCYLHYTFTVTTTVSRPLIVTTAVVDSGHVAAPYNTSKKNRLSTQYLFHHTPSGHICHDLSKVRLTLLFSTPRTGENLVPTRTTQL